jgi:hypothetical protein
LAARPVGFAVKTGSILDKKRGGLATLVSPFLFAGPKVFKVNKAGLKRA